MAKHLCGQGKGEKCIHCEKLSTRMINLQSELRFLRRQFALLRTRCEKILKAHAHDGGGKFF